MVDFSILLPKRLRLILRLFFWWGRRDSNPRPAAYLAPRDINPLLYR